MNVIELQEKYPRLREIVSGWRVVVVDDEPDNVEVVVRLLKFFGAVVDTAEHGRKGLELVQAAHPSFIIADLSMPVMDGWEFIQQLQAHDLHKAIPVVALTAHAMMGDRERIMKAGFFAYFAKPLEAAVFIVELMKLFDPLKVEAAKSRSEEVQNAVLSAVPAGMSSPSKVVSDSTDPQPMQPAPSTGSTMSGNGHNT